MKKLLILFFVFSASNASTQSLQKRVMNATGKIFESNGIRIKTSVGEPIAGNLNINHSTRLSQGFFTGYSLKQIIDPNIPSSNSVFSIYPNPASEILYIKGPVDPIKSLELFDLAGKRISRHVISSAGIVVSGLAKGFYVGKLTDKSNNVLAVFKIIKL